MPTPAGLRFHSLLRIGTVLGLLSPVILPAPVAAQDPVEVYGSLRIHIAGFEGERDAEVQDNVSRLGARLYQDIGGSAAIIARMEWSLNLVDSDVQLNLDGSTESEFAKITPGDRGETFGTRLGYLGFDFGRFGTLTAGKQWSVYYDITQWTDLFRVFGANATSTYNARTDGGLTGTGRAEKSLVYRSAFGPVSLGAQMQLRGAGDHAVDSYGFSGHVELLDGVSLGATYNKALVDLDIPNLIGGRDDATAFAAGLRYDRGPLYVGFTVATEDGNELANIDDFSVIYDGTGAELYVHYNVSDKVRLIGGGNYFSPDDPDASLDDDFEVKYGVLGINYFFTPNTLAYAEVRLDDGTTADGTDGFHVITVGARWDFSFKPRLPGGDEENGP